MKEQITFNIPEKLVKFVVILSVISSIFFVGGYLGTKQEERKVLSMLKENHFFVYACTVSADEISDFTFQMCKTLKQIKVVDKENVAISAYSASADETDDSPNVPAAGGFNKMGQIAVSPDLFKRGWTFNKTVVIDNLGTFVIRDLMNERFTKKVDVFMGSKEKAKKFGTKKGTASLIE
jgi:3D (Asp-Asp-Asp) domain-containing protein